MHMKRPSPPVEPEDLFFAPAAGETDSRTSDVGHWLGMTALRAGGGKGFFGGRNYISGRENDILGR